MRRLQETDYPAIIAKVDEWWGGRAMTGLLPRLFFQHFSDSSWVIEDEGEIVGFLVGFLSQTHTDTGYIHFVGVHPAYRSKGLGRQLYEQFFQTMRDNRRHIVEAITSPMNRGSVAFHTRLGFTIVPGDGLVDAIPVHRNYDGRGGDRVILRKVLA
jgi:ribosomal protein S18 acetylase RimI-like enzyme